MKNFAITLLLSTIALSSHAQSYFFDQADKFFGRYVSNGLVDYQAIRQNPQVLNDLLKEIEENGQLDASSTQNKAYLINAYNLMVIKGIVEAASVSSTQDIPGFFDNKVYTMAGKKIILNYLEKEILLKQTADSRLHFALVCGALGCPKIIKNAYRPESLEEQLNAQTQQALNDPLFTKVDDQNKELQLSQIFSWYRSEFVRDGNSLIEYVNQYRQEKISADYKISFYEYDWRLNERKLETKTIPQDLTSNLLQFTPSQLFGLGQYEINIFNNLYSQTSVRDDAGNEIENNFRSSILTSTWQFTYGISKKAKLNVGADLVLAAGSVGEAPGNQFQIFGETNASDFAVAAFGPRVKFQPLKKYPFYSVQISLLFPVANDLEAQTSDRDVFLALNRYQWKTQFFYDFKLTQQLRLFYQFDINYQIRRNREEVFFEPNFVDLPSTLFLNYFPTDKLSFFVMGQYLGRFGNTRTSEQEATIEKKFGLLQWTTQVGTGMKYQATSRLGFELSYGNFIDGRGFAGIEAGAGEVVNFGIRFIN